MDKLWNIIEITDDRYVLNNDLLHSALTLADNCDNIALISIVGPKSHGKTFLINCLINYINSENKEEWPDSEDAIIEMYYRPQCGGDITCPVIKLTSSPYIIIDETEDKVIRTAVFLMDSDFVFDIEMSSKQVQDIIALFLLTSSTVIYNHKRYLPPQEFLRLEAISSSISYLDNSLDSLKNIVFLIRDWSPETRNNEFSFGIYEGSKYIENFIENMILDKRYEDLNCFLMSAPELDTQTEVIKLSELNNQFLLDLKCLVDFKLLNIDEMQKKITPNTNQYINASELFELFETCVKIMNQDIDNNLLVDRLSAGMENLTIQEQSRDETDLCENETELEMNASDSVLVNGSSPTSESYSDNSTDNSKLEAEKRLMKSLNENPANGTENSNFCDRDLIDLFDESDSIVSSPESAEDKSNVLRDDSSFSILGGSREELMSEDESDNTSSSEKHNISNTCTYDDTEDSSNPQMIENNMKILKVDLDKSSENNNLMSDLENNMMNSTNKGIEESEINYINYTYDNTKDSSNQLMIGNNIKTFEIDSQNSSEKNNLISDLENNLIDKPNKAFKESKIIQPLECQSMPNICETLHRDLNIVYHDYENYDNKRKNDYKISDSFVDNGTKDCERLESQSLRSFPKLLHQDVKSTSYHNSDSHYQNKFENNYKTNREFEDEKNAHKTEIENRFKELVNNLILQYYKSMEIKLKDETLDSDRDLKETHEKLKQKILEIFDEIAKDIKPSLIACEYRDKYYTELNDKMKEAIKTYEHKVEVKLNEAHNQYPIVLRQISVLYKMDMKSSIMGQIRDDLHIKDLSQIQRLCKEKAFKLFKEETVKFFIGNIETEFLRKLNEEITQIDYNFETLWDHYRTLESERQQNFSNSKYYSDEKIKEFHENQKSRIIYSVEKFNDSDMIQLAVYLLNKSFDLFEERNNLIEKKEENFAINAIDLAFKLYNDYFEAKLRTGFFERNEVNNICDQLLEYTTKQLIASCNFNEYQNYLNDKCIEGLKLKVENMHETKSNEYEEKICSTKINLGKAREEAFKTYCHSMNAKPSTSQRKTYLKINEFTELHHRYSKMVIESFNKSVEFLNKDYDPEFANKVLLENQSLLRKLITDEKQKLKTKNDKNTPDIHSMAIYLGKQYIIAATHRNGKYEIISDKFGQNLRPNSISFGNEILIGSEAKNYYESSYPDIISFKNFDIKQLFGRERSLVSNEELNTYPFTFLKDELSVSVDFHGFNIDLSVESLLAFMILDIKLCAEKQIGNMISNIVLTVPTNYTIVQKNAVRNAAKIAGFEDCDVISELSAAAISYAVGRVDYFNKYMDTVLFVIINDYECDVAICYITNKNIVYKKYYHQTLNSTEEEKRNFLQRMMKSNRKSEENDNKIAEYKFKELIDRILNKSNLKSSVQIDECVIVGNSLLIPDIKIWINKYINPIPSDICNSMDTIIKGSAFYAEMLANKINFIEISEVTTHNIYLNFDVKNSIEKIIEVMHRNTPLPKDKSIEFPSPKSKDLPMKITVSQDNLIVTTHLINTLPFSDYSYHEYNKHVINFKVDCFGQIYVMSVLSNKKHTSGIKLESIDVNPGINEKKLGQEKQKLCSLINKIQEKIKINEEKLCLGEVISELSRYCSSVKNEVENNPKLRPLIKKQILLEIEKTLSFLSGENLALNDITKQKQMLDKTLEGYMQ